MSLAHLIDHTILKPNCTKADVEKVCKEAIKYQFAAVCIPPFFVKDAVSILEETKVKVATVVGFPMGYATISAKVEEIKRALEEGVDEIDSVANIAAIKNGNWNTVKNDIDSVTRAVHMRGKMIKVAIETTLLTEEEIRRTCQICIDSGVNFVNTSTGYQGGASVEAVKLLRAVLLDNIKIKASGGILNQKQANELVEAGADRLGCSASIAIVEG